jgi:2-polyprenyl-3-methyl-5-hydroxy-6-metoxy-1,4-benzoquinol methylase
MSHVSTPAIDTEKLNALMGQALVEVGGTFNAALVLLGEELGLYRTLHELGAMSADALAAQTGTDARYVREWLSAQAASGFVTYDPTSDRFHLTPEQAMAFAIPDSPAYLPGSFQVALAATRARTAMLERFRTGHGLGWHEHDHGVFEGTERFFRTSYNTHLVPDWLPALDGVVEKLKRGATVADVGCGHGASTIIMAGAFPSSRFVGYDYHERSVEQATERARSAGVDDRVRFEVASAKSFPGKGYDLVTMFDCLHDMGDPVGAARHVRASLAVDGTWMIVEPVAHDTLAENLNPVSRLYYAASTFLCTPASRSQEVGLALGAQAGASRLTEVLREGGFTRVRRATETPFNMVLEARP